MIGKPCAGKLHARFDEGELEIERFSHYASSLLYPFLTPYLEAVQKHKIAIAVCMGKYRSSTA
jgi:hypothetical protein